MYDIVRVYFNDGTSTVFHVHEDDSIVDEIENLCERSGWDPMTVDTYTIEGQIEEDK